MSKSKKLNLGELKVESFVTSLDDKEAANLKGGKMDETNWCGTTELCTQSRCW